ncbi:glycosyltransferase family 39 protein [Lolliginicoccus levis]|uniref:glycosyltransferase family 39 protein n=1 Tax=Lolliginicoccus levis TaxID=2919542 RepID=UPI002420243A|nr:glycosyltransferase family 39 protein [Lolliginicoccus levis]
MRRDAIAGLASGVLYLAVGLWLALRHHYLMGDALARVASAEAVLHSRDPHLAALGFVFTPLPAMAQLPAVALTPWIPEITRFGLSGVLMSTLFMAGTVYQVSGIVHDRGIGGWPASALVAAFALHPMIIIHGANGMSEAVFLFFLLWTVRRLVRWYHSDDANDLAVAGLALAGAYLARYDAVVVVAAGILAVYLVSYTRRSLRLPAPAMLDAVIVGFPFAVAFAMWAGASWLLTGDALAQFSSQYGNTAILEASDVPRISATEGLGFSLAEIMVLAPALPIVAPIAFMMFLARRERELIVPVAIIASVLVFQAIAFTRGLTFPFLRFYICAIPLVVLLVIHLYPRAGAPRPRRRGRFRGPAPALPRSRAWGNAGVLLVCASLPVSLWSLTDRTLATQHYALTAIVAPGVAERLGIQHEARSIIRSFSTERRIATFLDSQVLPAGSVIVDSVYGFAITAASENPEQFVIPSDGDFVTILDDPAGNSVRYLLVVPNEGRGATDAVNLRYPTMFENGSQIATLELEVPNDGANQPPWRLYRVMPSS